MDIDSKPFKEEGYTRKAWKCVTCDGIVHLNYKEAITCLQTHDTDDVWVPEDVDAPKNKIEQTTEAIMKDNKFATVKETKKILLFNGKFYDDIAADTLIGEETEKSIEHCSNHHVHEVEGKIRRRTYRSDLEFDRDIRNITLDNGILNLDTMKMKKHSYHNLTRISIPLSYHEPEFSINGDTIFEDIEKNLNNTKFWKFITSSHTINGVLNKERLETCLEIIASFFIKHHIDQRSFMFLGNGENGKSVLLEYIKSLLGEKNYKSIPLQEIEEDRFMRAELAGQLANIFTDLEMNELKKTGKTKAISANESIIAQQKGKDPFDMHPICKLLFSCNRFPKVDDQTQGFFRKWIIVKWERNFENDPERDEHLLDDLKENQEEKDKVFSSLIYLANLLEKNGKFTHSKNWKEIQRQWNENAVPITNFENNYIIDSDGNKSVRETYNFYREICYETEQTPLGPVQFSNAFKIYHEQDRITTDGRTERVWLNIDFKKPKQIKLDDGVKTLDQEWEDAKVKEDSQV